MRSRAAGVVPALIGAVMLAVSGPAAALAPQTAPAATAPAASANAFQEQAVRLGVRRCANLFSVLGNSATLGSTYAVQVQANRAAPDAHAVTGVAGMTYDAPEIRGQAAAVAVAAPVGSSCEGQMVRVAPFQRPCQEVAGLLPAGSSVGANLSGVPLYNLGGNQGQALLLANGATCVVVTFGAAADSR